MKIKFCVIILFSLFLNACINTSAIPTIETADVTVLLSSATDSGMTEESATEIAPKTTTGTDSREAVLSEVDKTVLARATQNDSLMPAAAGMKIQTNGGVETGSDGRARLDLLPDGTIIRVGPNSSFILTEITKIDGEPKTTIELFFGKIYILLNGGSLSVKTPTGVAAVQGSVLSVEYDPETNQLKASCLEGHCSLKDEEDNEVELTDGESSYIEEDEPPTDPEMIDSEEIQEWLDEVPEMPEFFDELPNPEDFPEPEFTEEPTEEPTELPEATMDPEATTEPQFIEPEPSDDPAPPEPDPDDGS